jgi:hypothetical protein
VMWPDVLIILDEVRLQVHARLNGALRPWRRCDQNSMHVH